jgi:2-polyprenyl-3-methyl-5-hydroxy-6-metoxy-1,4-benzoquinol methylase
MYISNVSQRPGRRDMARVLTSGAPESGMGRLKTIFRPYVCPLDLLLDEVQPGDRVADVGCGRGQLLKLVASFREPAQLVGLEIDPKLIEEGAEVLAGCPVPHVLHYFNGAVFGGLLRSSNVVFLNDVLHHVPQNRQGQFIDDLIAALQPDARLILKDIDASSPLVYANKIHDALLGGGAGHELRGSVLVELLETAGMTIRKVLKVRRLAYPHVLVVAEKRSN